MLQCKLDSRCHSARSSGNSNTLHFATRQMQSNYPVSKISTPGLLQTVSWDVKSDSLQPRQRGACKRGSRWRERETRLASEKPGRRRDEASCKRGKEESPGKVGSSFLPCLALPCLASLAARRPTLDAACTRGIRVPTRASALPVL